MNTSATGGFLAVTSEEGQYDLDDVLHALISGITGLPGDLVRPRWQPDPPAVPEPDVDWCAFGVQRFEPANLPVITHHGEGDGHAEIKDTEELEVLVSFYGPGHLVRVRAFRRGIYIPQNRDILRPAGLAFVRAGTIVRLPEAVAFGWRQRADIPLAFRLETISGAAVLNILSVGGSLLCGQHVTHFGCHNCARVCGAVNRSK